MILKLSDVISDRYEIIEKLGSGGMSIVYKAMDRKLDRFVTVKVLREEFSKDNEFIKRFEVEARSVGRLSHNNIVNVYDVGQDQDINYIVMEYIEGFTLKELINKKAPFENSEILGVSIQIAEALKHAHNNKIIHRDIKPDNILITTKGVVKVTDFGIARAITSQTVTADEKTLGSVHYFSPEQARGGFLDQKSDIYSLGIVMFEMATKTLPYEGDTVVAIALKHLNEEVPDVEQINPNVFPSIAKIINKAMQKPSANRYQTMDEFLEDLREAQTDTKGDFVKVCDTVNCETKVLSKEDTEEIKSGQKNIIPKAENPSGIKVFIKENKKIVISATITSVIIIIFLSGFYINYAKRIAPKKIPVPNLTGVELIEARNSLKRDDIKIEKEVLVFDDKIPKSHVVSVDAAGLTELYAGKNSVVLYVSRGKSVIIMPNLTAINEQEAHKIISESQLIYDRTEYQNSNDTPSGIVFKQEPEAGKEVDKSTSVVIYVSEGPAKKYFTVADYTNYKQTEAERLAGEAGFIVQRTQKIYHNSIPKGEVIKQTPEPGTEAIAGVTKITLYVSDGPEPATSANEKSKKIDLNFEIPEDLTSVDIKVSMTKDGVTTQEDFIKNVPTSEFPYTIEFKNSGLVEEYYIEVFSSIDSRRVYHTSTGPIDFDSL